MKRSKLIRFFIAVSAFHLHESLAAESSIVIKKFKASQAQGFKLRSHLHVRSGIACAAYCSVSEECRGYCLDQGSKACFLDHRQGGSSLHPQDGLRCFERGKEDLKIM